VADRSPGGIYVLAGCNGAGKSSIAGEAHRNAGLDVYDPDRVARTIMARHGATVSQQAANAMAWEGGRRLLQRAIDQRGTFAFETTLGGTTITALLGHAIGNGIPVHVWFIGLASVQMHVERVKRRVAKGGHDIPLAMIRRRYTAGPRNLVALLPGLRRLYLYDNSREGDPDAGRAPSPQLVLHAGDRRIVAPRSVPGLMAKTPQWAKPIIAASLALHLAQKT
jgi:predicted ABC-type ATPase